MCYEYGRKKRAVIDTDLLSIQGWKITTASVYGKNTVFEIINAVGN